MNSEDIIQAVRDVTGAHENFIGVLGIVGTNADLFSHEKNRRPKVACVTPLPR